MFLFSIDHCRAYMDKKSNRHTLLPDHHHPCWYFFRCWSSICCLFRETGSCDISIRCTGFQVLQEKELANVRLEVTETTLREVAADLHDDTGQLLTVAIMQLNRLSKNAPDETVEQALHAVRSGLDSVRNISRILNSDYLRSFGLKQLQRLKERLEKGGKLHLRMIWMMTLYGQTLRWSYTHSGSSRSLCPTPSNMQKQQKSIFN